MPPSQPPPKLQSGLLLYADLLDKSSPNTGNIISRAPVIYKQEAPPPVPPPQEDEAKKKLNSSALRFQPTKRPQLQKPKVKAVFYSKAAQISSVPSSSTSPLPLPSSIPADTAAPQTEAFAALPFIKSSVADWTNEAGDDDYYASMREKHQRGGKKKRKKNNKAVEQDMGPTEPAWNAIYDSTRPNIYRLYVHSDEKYRELRDWRERLYAHRSRPKPEPRHSTDLSDKDERPSGHRNSGFAPPSSFAPPASYDESPQATDAEDPYARRMRLSNDQHQKQHHHQPEQTLSEPQIAASPPPPFTQDSSTISRAPVRHDPSAPNVSTEEPKDATVKPTQKTDEPASEEPKSNRPGQKGFAARMMAKYGWEQGQGLGATGTGIITPLQAQAKKRKKLSDAQGGGFASPAIGKIVGGKKPAAVQAEEKQRKAKYGTPSEVVCLQGMLYGVSIDDPEERGDVVEEIGIECGEKYGRVERVFIHPGTRRVFVKFTSQLSALRALDALEGRAFNGNKISAHFWETEKFDAGQYDV